MAQISKKKHINNVFRVLQKYVFPTRPVVELYRHPQPPIPPPSSILLLSQRILCNFLPFAVIHKESSKQAQDMPMRLNSNFPMPTRYYFFFTFRRKEGISAPRLSPFFQKQSTFN